MSHPVHHIELWTHDLDEVEHSFGWLLERLGWSADHAPDWPQGRTWRHPEGVYLVLEQSPAVERTSQNRMRPGLNHLALRTDGRSALDALRRDSAANGWTELFAEAFPHAGGPAHVALFLENAQGFEVEIVAPTVATPQ